MTPLERAARAVHDCLDLQLAHMTGREMVNDGTVAAGIARAVLTAIREPSEAMKLDGNIAMKDQLGVEGYKVPSDASWVAWQAMIDAALAEGE